MLEPLVVPVAGAGAGAELEGNELPLAAEPGTLDDVLPCTLDEVPLVGGQAQFEALALALGLELAEPLLLDGSDDDPLALEGALALGEVDELLMLGLELAEPLLLDGSDDDPLALEGALALGDVDELLMLGLELLAEPPSVEPLLAEEDALGGQEQFSAPLVAPLVEPLTLDEPVTPVAPPPVTCDGAPCAAAWPRLAGSELVEDCAKAGPNVPITAAAVILTARCRALIFVPFVSGGSDNPPQALCPP